MNRLEKLSERFGKYMAVIVLMVAAAALFEPSSSLWIQTSWINYLLMIVMFGMGLTIKPADFVVVFTRPRDVLLGCVLYWKWLFFIICLDNFSAFQIEYDGIK